MKRSRGPHFNAPRLPTCQANPQRPQNRNIPQPPTHKTQKSELVTLAYQPVPANALLRQDKPDLYIRHRGALGQSVRDVLLAAGERDVQSSPTKTRFIAQRELAEEKRPTSSTLFGRVAGGHKRQACAGPLGL